MFTIKNMWDGGYTVYETEQYSVQWRCNVPPQILIDPRDDTEEPAPVRVIDVTGTAYITNAAGRTIDKVVNNAPVQPPTRGDAIAAPDKFDIDGRREWPSRGIGARSVRSSVEQLRRGDATLAS